MFSHSILEEELKNKVAEQIFWLYDCTRIIGKIDFCVSPRLSPQHSIALGEQAPSLLWAEAKKGVANLEHALVQLILTIGRARTFDHHLPPRFLGAFDAETILLLPYEGIRDIFYLNDFNWMVTPSDHSTREFQLALKRVEMQLHSETLRFQFEKDQSEIKLFLERNFDVTANSLSRIRIDKNNFMVIYAKWLEAVKPSIAVNWSALQKSQIIDGDFYLADLMSRENKTLGDKLYVLLEYDRYRLSRRVDHTGLITASEALFNDGQKAHRAFWARYARPPEPEYWDFILNRRDLLVPQDVRERKGSFFTPQRWVELSQQYLTRILGENWQEEYIIWDCAAGTGNLLTGLTNKYNIWASTLDQQDVDVMHDRIRNGANLLESHVFQFDFLNDSFESLPEGLREIVEDPERRKRLLIYINPPYVEAANARAMSGSGKNRPSTSISNLTYQRYAAQIGSAGNELFAQFLIRIYAELEGVRLAEFSKLKILQGSNFKKFLRAFQPSLDALFLVPANTFDNVKGNFPIGFFIWNTAKRKPFTRINADVYNAKGELAGQKTVRNQSNVPLIGPWLASYLEEDPTQAIAMMRTGSNDFQNQRMIYIAHEIANVGHSKLISLANLIPSVVFFAIRFCLPATWLNDRDQFYWPSPDWANDRALHLDSLAYTLFHGANRISCEHHTNDWIPFTEHEVNAKDRFKSHFMSEIIQGKRALLAPTPTSPGSRNSTRQESRQKLIISQPESSRESAPGTPLRFSAEATSVFEMGRELWRYYHAQPGVSPNAGLYDIRLHFQGRNARGQMNPRSNDDHYSKLIAELRQAVKELGDKRIAPKVYQYGFLPSDGE